MPKKIVLLSDGTGNSAAKLFKTNVWRVFQSLDLQDPQIRAIYDDGVGTDHFAPVALLGGAMGLGLAKNIRDLYEFLCRNYEEGDEIYAFGFSRGAFTIRSLVGMVTSVGLVKAGNSAQLQAAVEHAYREHRKQFTTVWAKLRQRIQPDSPRFTPKKLGVVPPIRFLGLWDTVAAYGLPIDELQRGIDMYFRAHSFPHRRLAPNVQRACHALSLDDERRTFHPMLWDERGEPEGRISQVWFAGVHSDVGGGYPKEALSYVPLAWIMSEAEKAGLRFKGGVREQFEKLADPHGELHDSRSGMAAYYRYAPRDVATLTRDDYVGVHIARPKIHESVFARVRDGRVAYAPVGIPAEYDIVQSDGTLLPGPHETRHQTEARTLAQDRVADFIWHRRALYFATLGLTLMLAAFPLLFSAAVDSCEGPLCWLGSHVLLPIGAVLPDWLQRWTHAYAAHPGAAIGCAVALYVSIRLSGYVADRIQDSSERAWHHVNRHELGPTAYRPGLVHKLRSAQLLVGPYLWFARTFIPTGFAAALLSLGLTIVNHGLFASASAMNLECEQASGYSLVEGEPMTVSIDKLDACSATGLRLSRGYTYDVHVEPESTYREGILSPLFTPFRRVLGRSWDALFLKVDAHVVPLTEGNATVRADGDLFLFANHAVLALPWLWKTLYPDDGGRARITVTPRHDRSVLTSASH
jgi:hypothetical protein